MKITVGLLLLGFVALAQHQHPAPPPEKPVALLPGLGTWRHPIATRSAEAQKFFDQGLTLLYGFNRYEALRSFQKSAELDPKAAMALWGVAMAAGPYINMDLDPVVDLKKSCAAAAAGLRVASASGIEHAWLEAAAARCPDFADPARYIAAMRSLAARLPDDPDAQSLYAEALMLPSRWRWYAEGKPADGMPEAERVLEAVLRRYPDHPGANHFYIHAVESSPTPERGVPSAQRLMGIVPEAGHLLHMPGHIWLVLGDYDNTVAVNERAVAVDREYFARTGVTGSYGMYYLHNQQFILYARAMQGRTADTRKAAAEMSETVKGMADAMPDMADIVDSYITLMRVRMRWWDEVLKSPKPKASAPAVAFWHYARAVALLGRHRAEEARREQAEFEKLRPTLDRNMVWDTNKLGDMLDVASAELAARMESSADGWRRAVGMVDKLAYDEPPAWYYPMRESLGAAQLRSGDAAGAETVFREGLRRSPNNGRMLFGLRESLRAQGKRDAMAWVEREFQRAWKGADVALRIEDL